MVISKKSSQMIYHEEDCPYAKRMSKKHRQYISEKTAIEKGYRPCTYCGGLHRIYLNLKKDPNAYKKIREGVTESYDRIDKGLCFRTKVGFWKVLNPKQCGEYRLWHLNHNDFDEKIPDKQLMRRSFHRQNDVKATANIVRIIQYIHDHDKAKRIMNDDWKKLPNKTPKQKKYYRQAAKRERKKQNRRIDELFKKLEKGEL